MPSLQAAMEVAQVMTPLSEISDDTQIMATYAIPTAHTAIDLQSLQNEETFVSNYNSNFSNWEFLLPTDYITTMKNLGQHATLESKFAFGWDDLSHPQGYASAGYQPVHLDAPSTVLLEGSGPYWQSDFMASSSTTYCDFPDLSSTSSTLGFLSEHSAPNFSPPTMFSAKTNSRKRRHHGNSNAAFKDKEIERKKPKLRPRKAVALCESAAPRSSPKYTAVFRQQAENPISQFKQLLDKETSVNSLSASSKDTIPPVTPSLPSFSILDVKDSRCPIETGHEIPVPPLQAPYNSKDILIAEMDMAHSPVAFKTYQCTFPECHYSSDFQVDWKRHEGKAGHWPQERFMCLQCNMPSIDLEGNPTCEFCSLPFSILGDARTHYLQCMCAREKGKTFGRKDHLCKHLEVEHGRKDMIESTKAWSYPVLSDWPRECGFCGRIFETWDQRMTHIGYHYQDGLKKSSWKLPFPQPKDHKPHEIESIPDNEDSDGDEHNGRGLKGDLFGYSSSSSQFSSGSTSSDIRHRHELQSQQTYRKRQPHYAPRDSNRVALSLLKIKTCKTGRGLSAFPLCRIFGLGKTKAAREYINKYDYGLLGGGFWFGSRLEPGVESSLWSIAFQATRSYQKRNCEALQVLLNLWQNIHQIPRAPYSSKVQLNSQHKYSGSTTKSLAVVGSPKDTILSQYQRYLCACHRRIENAIKFSHIQSLIIDPNSNHMTEFENHDQFPLPEFNFSENVTDEFRETCSSQSIHHGSLSGHQSSGPLHRRGPWSPAEDMYLIQLVHTQGALNWVRIAHLIGSRSPKQCRERYHQSLKPSLNHEPITPQEGQQIGRMVREMGKRWAEIARRLNQRSDNAVKNWWNGSMNRRRHLTLQRRTSSQNPKTDQPESLAGLSGHRLSIKPPGFSPRFRAAGSILSPAISEASRADSIDDAPSLVSDNSSAFYLPPPLPAPPLSSSPRIELPPLNLSNHDKRRPSLPSFSFRPNTFLSANKAHPFPSRPPSDAKFYGPATPSLPVHQSEKQISMASPEHYDFKSQAQLPINNLVQLPRLQISAQSEPQEISERDSRMQLSALLG